MAEFIDQWGFRADLIVEDNVIVEIKSVEAIAPVHKKQLLTHLRLADKRLGLLINFNVAGGGLNIPARDRGSECGRSGNGGSDWAAYILKSGTVFLIRGQRHRACPDRSPLLARWPVQDFSTPVPRR